MRVEALDPVSARFGAHAPDGPFGAPHVSARQRD
jgi:hypothetical protein